TENQDPKTNPDDDIIMTDLNPEDQITESDANNSSSQNPPPDINLSEN
ncbi:14157_t:CDS:1, partial [Racocetra persica]